MKTFTISAVANRPCVTLIEVQAENETEAIKKAKECDLDAFDWEIDWGESVGVDQESLEFAIIDIGEPEEF